MKILFILIMTVSSVAYAACNRKVFDDLYKQITLRALKKDATRLTYVERNEAITVLRELCNDQKSRYEAPCRGEK